MSSGLLWDSHTAVGSSIDPEEAVGKTCLCVVQRGEFRGRPKNEPVSFSSLRQAAPVSI